MNAPNPHQKCMWWMEPAVEALLTDDTQSSSACFSSGGDAHGLKRSSLGRMYLLMRLTTMPAAIGSRMLGMADNLLYFDDA